MSILSILGQTGAKACMECGERARAERDRLMAENERLRELAKSAWGCVNRHVSCDACRMTCGGCTLQSAMRELGIEADR